MVRGAVFGRGGLPIDHHDLVPRGQCLRQAVADFAASHDDDPHARLASYTDAGARPCPGRRGAVLAPFRPDSPAVRASA
jgi:hypothetical protein